MRDHSAGHKRELIAPTVNTDSKGEFRNAIENRPISAVFLFFGRFSPEATSGRQTPLDSATDFPRVPSEISFGLKPPCVKNGSKSPSLPLYPPKVDSGVH